MLVDREPTTLDMQGSYVNHKLIYYQNNFQRAISDVFLICADSNSFSWIFHLNKQLEVCTATPHERDFPQTLTSGGGSWYDWYGEEVDRMLMKRRESDVERLASEPLTVHELLRVRVTYCRAAPFVSTTASDSH